MSWLASVEDYWDNSRTTEAVHCWKKKRDFQIIRSKVGGFLTQSVADNEYW